jgi:hypothetical protein
LKVEVPMVRTVAEPVSVPIPVCLKVMRYWVT